MFKNLKNHVTNYSKMVMTIVLFLYIGVALYTIGFGSFMVYTTQMYLGDLLNFIGVYVMTGMIPTLIGYFGSKTIENKEKIKQSVFDAQDMN